MRSFEKARSNLTDPPTCSNSQATALNWASRGLTKLGQNKHTITHAHTQDTHTLIYTYVCIRLGQTRTRSKITRLGRVVFEERRLAVKSRDWKSRFHLVSVNFILLFCNVSIQLLKPLVLLFFWSLTPTKRLYLQGLGDFLGEDKHEDL